MRIYDLLDEIEDILEELEELKKRIQIIHDKLCDDLVL